MKEKFSISRLRNYAGTKIPTLRRIGVISLVWKRQCGRVVMRPFVRIVPFAIIASEVFNLKGQDVGDS